MKISTIRMKITPPVGTLLAGYGKDVVSDGVHDDLLITGLSFDDGKNKAILLSYDLVGMDKNIIQNIRKKCAVITGLRPENIILTCTHTHSGPHTRSLPEIPVDGAYTDRIADYSAEAVKDAFKNMKKVSVFHYSIDCHENINRRVILPDNTCRSLPLNKHLASLANGITDPELGIVYFVDDRTSRPVAVMVNYAAHPLTCNSGGAASLKITSDYPNALRNCAEKELGGLCLFTSGACGDLHPKNFENGFDRTKEMGMKLALKVIGCFRDAVGNEKTYKLVDPDIKTHLATAEVSFRKSGRPEERMPVYRGRKKEKVEIQFLKIGEICLVGMPGELCVEPGLEIKWHSPFRKTYILYNSTAYLSYIVHANAYISGGYEAESSQLEPLAAFKIVSKTIEGLHFLHKSK